MLHAFGAKNVQSECVGKINAIQMVLFDFESKYYLITKHQWNMTRIKLNMVRYKKHELPYDTPTPKGESIRITTYNDANLMHNMIKGRSKYGVFVF